MIAAACSSAAAIIGLSIGLVMGYRAGQKRIQTVIVFPSVKEGPLVLEADNLRRREDSDRQKRYI